MRLASLLSDGQDRNGVKARDGIEWVTCAAAFSNPRRQFSTLHNFRPSGPAPFLPTEASLQQILIFGLTHSAYLTHKKPWRLRFDQRCALLA